MCADVEADADDEGTACKAISCDECTEVTPEICENDQLYVPAADVRRMRQKQHALADGESVIRVCLIYFYLTANI